MWAAECVTSMHVALLVVQDSQARWGWVWGWITDNHYVPSPYAHSTSPEDVVAHKPRIQDQGL